MLTAKEIGKRAQNERKRARLSQQEVAVHFGLDKQTISRWETGETELTVSRIIALARLYRCSAYAILLDPPAPAQDEPPEEPSTEAHDSEPPPAASAA